MSKAKRTALVTGASGLAGGYMLTHLLEQGGWDIVAVSRRKPQIPGNYRHIAVDLLDPADCQTKLGSLTDISHLFYLAITERADPSETVSANANMFFNLVKTVEAASGALEHVHLSQGTRWYGNHLGPYKTPTKEDDPRHMPPNFYYDQQDFLEDFQKGKRWTWSVGRPHAVCGFSTGGPMNLTLAIAVYANICKTLGLPLSFPGKPGAYTALYQCTDAALLAKAVEWMATDLKCANRRLTSPIVILSGGRTYGPNSPISLAWSWLRHDTSTLRGRWPTRVRYGTGSSKTTDCRNTASKSLRLGATRTAYSHRITISSPIPARPAVSDSTT
jgi:nucleoside-diphosphate-sugar epimerase